MKGKPTHWQPWQLDWLQEHYADTSNAECCEALGIRYRTMRRMAAELGLSKSSEYMTATQEHAAECAAVMNRGEGNRGKYNLLKYGKAHQFRKERIRINWGLEQRTRMRLVANRPQCVSRHALKKRGYIVSRGATTAYYNTNTLRSTLVERHAQERGITIKSA